MSEVPRERRKAAIKEFIENSFKLSEEEQGYETESVVWLRHAVKGLYEEVFGGPFDNDKPTVEAKE